MKYVRGFFTFWRHFILGDDRTIAIAVMWSMLLTWSLSQYFFNIWVVIPASVIVLLAVICYGQTVDKPVFHERSERFRFLLATAIPFVIIVSVPSLVYRFMHHMVYVQYTLWPLVLCLVSASVLSLLLYRIYRKYPAIVVFIFGVVAYFTLLR